MEQRTSEILGVIMVLIPLAIWTLTALGFESVTLPESHFGTLIWTGVSLILGYNIKGKLEDSLPKKSETEGGKEE